LFFDEIPKNRLHESFELLKALPIFKEENNHKFEKKKKSPCIIYFLFLETNEHAKNSFALYSDNKICRSHN
jgi:hypothetical protein